MKVVKAFPRVHEVVCSFGFSSVREEHGGVIAPSGHDLLGQQLTVCDWISDIISKARAKSGLDYSAPRYSDPMI